MWGDGLLWCQLCRWDHNTQRSTSEYFFNLLSHGAVRDKQQYHYRLQRLITSQQWQQLRRAHGLCSWWRICINRPTVHYPYIVIISQLLDLWKSGVSYKNKAHRSTPALSSRESTSRRNHDDTNLDLGASGRHFYQGTHCNEIFKIQKTAWYDKKRSHCWEGVLKSTPTSMEASWII